MVEVKAIESIFPIEIKCIGAIIIHKIIRKLCRDNLLLVDCLFFPVAYTVYGQSWDIIGLLSWMMSMV